MNDLKLYQETEAGLEQALDSMEEVSTALGMELSLPKCAVARMEMGKPALCRNFTLQSGGTVKAIDPGGEYKYVGVEQHFKPASQTARKRARKEYLKRVITTWKSDLNGIDKVRTTNMWAVSVQNVIESQNSKNRYFS